MKTLLGMAAVATALVLSGCGTSLKKAYDARIDQTYAVGGGEYATGPRIYVFAKLVEQGGATAICGAWARESSNGNTAGADHDVLSGIRIEHSGQTLLRGVEDFPQRRFRSNMRNSISYCFLTENPWQPGYANSKPEIIATQFQRRLSRRVVTVFTPGPLPDVIQ